MLKYINCQGANAVGNVHGNIITCRKEFHVTNITQFNNFMFGF
jgi:hypothetical protein